MTIKVAAFTVSEKSINTNLFLAGRFDLCLTLCLNHLISEAVDLIECVEKKDRQFQPILRRCIANHAMPVMMLMSHGMDHDTMPDTSTMCMLVTFIL